MKINKTKRFHYALCLFLIAAVCLVVPGALSAASTGTTNLVRQFGSGYSSAGGDYISASIANGGLDLPYYYYIEVPAGLNRLRVSIYDADVGRGAANDWLSGGWNTSCTYTLFDPSGANRGSITGSAALGTNAGWDNIINTTTNLIAGHWQLVVNMTSAVTTGDDLNGFGIRADNGDDTSGGTEVNVYAHSFIPVGRVGTDSSTNTFHPYVTSGCNAYWNDWDGDNLSVQTYSSRTGENTGSFSGSGPTAWLSNMVPNFDTDLISNDSGIWTWTGTYTDTGAGGNFGVFYVGNYTASTPPPTTQPQANTFRIYLPRDGGGAPSKPVFSQKISFISGANPTIVGSTTRLRVELVIFNPAAQAITFSAANQVTAYVPGGGVVYAGNPVASQGTFTTPAIGGTGNITWNPGTVNGNNTYATFYYEINVTPPGAARLPVTGTPAANGSTARYVDETGQAATGTYTYGPLCELAVTPGGPNVPTWVAISCFEGNMALGQPTVEWHTGAENGSVGFHLWRKDHESGRYELVNPELLPALQNAMTGGVYRLADPGARSGEKTVYRIQEVDAWGNTREYGPFTVSFEYSLGNVAESDNFYKKKSLEVHTALPGFQSRAFSASDYEKKRLLGRQNVMSAQRTGPGGQNSGQARIEVRGRGLYRVTAAAIAAALDMSVAQVGGLIASLQLSLTNLGEPIAWLADSDRSGIYFYNEPAPSAFSDVNVFWLEPGSGLAMETANGGAASPVDAGQVFVESRHYEENRYPLTSLFSNPFEDFWLWDMIIAGGKTVSFPMPVTHPASTGTAILTLNLKGATDTPADIDHHAFVYVNGRQIGETWWNGLAAQTAQFSFDQSILNGVDDGLSVRGWKISGVPYSYLYIDSFDLSYQRHYKAENNVLWCQGDGNHTISASGFTDPRVMVWDVSLPRRPKLVNVGVADMAGRITFDPASPDSRYLLIGLSAALPPLAITAASTTNLRNADAVEYVILAPRELAEAALPLAEYHRGRGLATAVVTLEDIYNNFNHGLASPLAIRDYLGSIYLHSMQGSSSRLKYAVLVGKGTFDYKNYLGKGDSLFPVMLAATIEGLFAADNLFGDLSGNDGIPEIAVGRLPVVSVQELLAVINKIKAYGSSQGPWTEQALMIADNTDSGGDFLATSDTLVSELSGYRVQRLSLLGYSNSDAIRQGIIDGINRGAALVNYVGHAGLAQLAEEDILSIRDLPLLQNSGTLPIMILVTCVAGRFDIPGNVCLGEAMLLKENGGIVTALAPTSASYNEQANLLADELYKAVFKAQEKDLGMAWLKAIAGFIAQAGSPAVLNVYNILGDPAVAVK